VGAKLYRYISHTAANHTATRLHFSHAQLSIEVHILIVKMIFFNKKSTVVAVKISASRYWT